MFFVVAFSIALIVGGVFAIKRGHFRGGPDGESRDYHGSSAKFWGYVWIVLGSLAVLGILLDIKLLKDFFLLFALN